MTNPLLRAASLAAIFIVQPACGTTADEPTAVADQALAAPYIDDVLTCGDPGTAGGLAVGNDLQRVEIDLAVFPNARCNDGSPGIFYFRPAATPAGADRWVIQLQGGGGCKSADDCARRWCSVGTNFGATQMTSALTPQAAIPGRGILYRGAAFVNPLEDANQVLGVFCSSDAWSGREGPLAVNAVDPVTGAAITYSIDFRGADILDAIIKTLRQDGVAGPVYDNEGLQIPLPDLDEASKVLFAGASAGGGGVINNGDRIGDELRATDLDGLLDYRLLIDSTFGPNPNDLEWSTSTECSSSLLCTWQDILAAGTAMYTRHGDTSCDAWHAANAPATAWLCDDTEHVIRNHVLTPMMVRMGLVDQLISDNLITSGVSDATGAAMTLPLFAQLVHDQLLALGTINVAGVAEETSPVAPALYGPRCAQHETLSNNVATYDVRIGKAGVPYTMFDVFLNWLAGAAMSQVVHDPGDPQACS